MNKGPSKKTYWARRNREVFDGFAGFRLPSEQLDRLKRIADLLNIDLSDLLRALVGGFALLPLKVGEIGANWDEINCTAKANPPTTSDKIRYV